MNDKIIIPIHNGSVWYKDNDPLNLGFIGIPKSASSGVREQLNLDKHILLNNTDKKLFSIIREPLGRYVSGYIEAMKPSKGFPRGRYHLIPVPSPVKEMVYDLYHKNISEIERFKIFTDYIYEHGFFEPHSVRQVDYLRDLTTKELFKNVEIFKLEDKEKLESFLNVRFEHRNRNEHPVLKTQLINFLKDDEPYNDIIHTLYKDDFDFYKQN